MLEQVIILLVMIMNLVLYGAYLQKRTPDAAQRFRRVAIGIGTLLVPMVTLLAVGPERILLAVGGAVFLRESFYLMKLNKRSERLNSIVDFIPVAIAIAFFYPYISMVAYFFGLDLAVFILAGIITLCYLLLKKEEEKTWHIYLNGLLLVVSLVMLSWTMVRVA